MDTVRKQRRREYIRERRRKIDELLDAIKFKEKCHFCRIDNPTVLQFHHLNEEGKEKENGIATMRADLWSEGKILHEVAKCIVVCANCHLMLHEGELVYSPVAER